MPREHLIPKAGLQVIDPETCEALPKKGAPKELTTWWRRRIADGDVTVKRTASSDTAQAAARGAKE